MAVTGAIFNRLIYGGIDSADYGIYITGEAVYNAPERAVDLVAVPGRSGDVVIDQGRWENIEIEYPAGCFADDQTAFATAISDFRNAICSQLGYQRLTDTYHPDEYRLAIYTSGIEVEPVRRDNGFGGEFTIKFNAKPQRWLTSGEDPVTVTSGDEITNPTLFHSQPLISVEGEGSISSANWSINVLHRNVGLVSLFPAREETATLTNNRFDWFNRQSIDTNLLAYQDDIYPGNVLLTFYVSSGRMFYPTSVSESGVSGAGLVPGNTNAETTSFSIFIPGQTVQFQSGSDYVHTSVLRLREYAPGSTPEDWTFTITISYLRVSPPGTMDYFSAVMATCQITAPNGSIFTINTAKANMDPVTAYSTILPGGAVVIDCETGEAYMENGGSIIEVNSSVSLGSDLPTLAPGANEITYDNTVTNLMISPRWWKI